MRPSATDVLAYQLEQQRAKESQLDTSPSSVQSDRQLHSSTLSLAQSPSSYASSKSPRTPATPWSQHDSATDLTAMPNKGDNGTGLGLSVGKPVGKHAGRGGVSKARAETEEEEEIDDDLEDELNDFGYGPRRTRRKEKKESLLDLLNSEPPSRMAETEPVPVSLPRKNSTLPSKIRRKFSSNAVDADIQAGFSTLQRGGGSIRKKDDTSPLRSSRSAGNLLSSFRSRTSNFGFKMNGGGGGGNNPGRSRERKQASVDLGSAQPSHGQNGSNVLDEVEFERLINDKTGTTTRKLTAKDAVSSTPTTRDLAEFLRSDTPPFDKSKSSLSLADTVSSSLLSSSTNTRSTEGFQTPGGGGGGDSASIVRAAMVKLGAAGRRASIGTSITLQNLVSNRPATSSGIPRLSPTRSRLKRPSTAQTVASEESAYDPQNKEAIQVDDSLMRGMFGAPRPQKERGDNGQDDEEEKERLRDSKVGESSPALGVYEFVAVDERESGGKSPELHRLGSLTKSKSLGNVSVAHRISVSSGPQSPSCTPSASKLPSPRRKPVPLGQEPSTLPRRLPSDSPSNYSALQERGDTSPLAVGESPVKGSLRPALPSIRSGPAAPNQLPFSSLVPAGDATTPTTPNELYSTPPLTPATPLSNRIRAGGGLSPMGRRTTSLSDTPEKLLRSRTSTVDSNESVDPTSTPSSLPRGPLPLVLPDSRSSSRTSSRKEGFQPRSMLLQPAELTSKRYSVIRPISPSPRPEETGSSTTTSRPTTTRDSLSPVDRDVLLALDTMRKSMLETAYLPFDSKVSTLDQLVPTLRGLQRSMEHGSKLLGAILSKLDETEERRRLAYEATRVEEEERQQEARLAEALLGSLDETIALVAEGTNIEDTSVRGDDGDKVAACERH